MIYVMTVNFERAKQLFERFSWPIARGLALLGNSMLTRRAYMDDKLSRTVSVVGSSKMDGPIQVLDLPRCRIPEW